MDAFFVLTTLVVLLSYTSADFHDEMQALEQDMMNDSNKSENNIKKSIKDLSTEELIAELEREFHDTKSDDSLHKKYRKRFENIINKREKLDKLANADIKTLLSAKRETDVYSGIIKALDESLNEKQDEVVGGECRDDRSDCKQLVGFCKTHKEKLAKACALTCKYCVKCEQKLQKGICENLRDAGKCDAHDVAQRNRMVRLCPVTCNYCRLPSPPKCSATKQGCCWDKFTAKKDAAGSNCPACENRYKYVCKTFKPDCESFRSPGTFMRLNCPSACQMCDGSCKDDKQKESLCPFWKKDLKWCVEKVDVMKAFCPKTCNFC